jgi:hypothetical protein
LTIIDDDPRRLARPVEGGLDPRLAASGASGGTMTGDPRRLARPVEGGLDPRLAASGASGDRLATDPLRDAQVLAASIENLRALLQLERRLIENWDAKLYGNTTAGSAARRLVALKHADRR